MHVDDLMRDLPVNGVDLRFRFEIEQTEIKRLLRFLLYLLNVVKALQAISTLQTLFHVQDVADEFMVFLCKFDFELRRSFLDGAERFQYQHGMVRDNGAPAFAHNNGMRDPFGIAHVHDVPDNVIGVFLERIIGRAIEITTRSIVIHAETAPDIQISKLMSELGNFCVITGTLTHSALDDRNIRYLRTDVEVD